MAKRTRSDSKTNHPKRLKLDPSDIEQAESNTTVLDLNEDCLTEIFVNLSQHDLINVILTDSRFRLASERAFSKNYGKSQTSVSMLQGNRFNAAVYEDSLRLLQAFGHLITKLLVKFKLENIAELLESIDENCGANIVELELCHFGQCIYQERLYKQGLEEMEEFLDGGLNKRFPKLNHLKLEYRNTSILCPYLKSLAGRIPSLKSFSIAGALFALDDILEFIVLNAQLEHLALIGEPDETCYCSLRISKDFIKSVDASLPQLKNVEISRVQSKTPYRGRPTKGFKNLTRLTIGDLADFQFSCRDASLFAGKNIEEICAYFVIHKFSSPFNFAGGFSRFQKLERLVFHLMIDNNLTNFQNWLLFEQLRLIISDTKQLTNVVIQLYRRDKTVAHEDSPYLELIKNVFFTAQWSMNEDANRLVFTKH